jgi:hypothetical protein
MVARYSNPIMWEFATPKYDSVQIKYGKLYYLDITLKDMSFIIEFSQLFATVPNGPKCTMNSWCM